jgi:hypothetical protein
LVEKGKLKFPKVGSCGYSSSGTNNEGKVIFEDYFSFRTRN